MGLVDLVDYSWSGNQILVGLVTLVGMVALVGVLYDLFVKLLLTKGNQQREW